MHLRLTSATRARAAVCVAVVLVLAAVIVSPAASARPARVHSAASSFVGPLHTITTVASAVPTGGPAKGDVNPYGVAVVPRTIGDLVAGNVLVSNFNNGDNLQGTGRSIVEISPTGHQHVFAVVPRPTDTRAVGLTTALAVLRNGFVIVGSLPAPGAVAAAAGAGALTILDPSGHVVRVLRGGDINGPWDMTALDSGSHATLFFTNVLNGTVAANGKTVHDGTVVRLTLAFEDGSVPRVTGNHVIASGFAEHTDPNALVVGPTGVGLGQDGTLYVADSNGNRIAKIPDALTRSTVLGGGAITLTSGGALNDPLGVVIAPNGDIVSANGADGRIVETAPTGQRVEVKTLVPDGGGDLFGLAVSPNDAGLYFVNDAGSGPAANSLDLLR